MPLLLYLAMGGLLLFDIALLHFLRTLTHRLQTLEQWQATPLPSPLALADNPATQDIPLALLQAMQPSTQSWELDLPQQQQIARAWFLQEHETQEEEQDC